MKGVKSKNVLFPPFKYSWPVVKADTEEEIMTKLQDVLSQLPCLMSGTNGGKKKQKIETDTALHDTRRRIRSMMAMGANQVMRGLEKDALAAVLVCRAAEPAMLTQPFVCLAACRQCPALALTTLASRLGPTLGISSLLALGFKKERVDSTFDEVVELIRSLATPLHLPCLKVTRKKPIINTSLDSDCGTSDKMEVDPDGEPASTGARNIEESGNVTSKEDSEASQPEEKKPQCQGVGQSKQAAPKDYSYLYVYKKARVTERKESRKFGGDFIPLGDKDRTKANSGQVSLVYSPCEVGGMVPNSQKSRKRKR